MVEMRKWTRMASTDKKQELWQWLSLLFRSQKVKNEKHKNFK
jgi:hypothetical protein